MVSNKVVIINVERGSIKSSKLVEDSIENAVKNVIIDVLPQWSPKNSDLIVIKHEHIVTLRLPISKDIYDEIIKYGFERRSSSEIDIKLPVYVVSYDNSWVDEDVIDNKVFVIAPYISEEVKKQIEELAIEVTTTHNESE